MIGRLLVLCGVMLVMVLTNLPYDELPQVMTEPAQTEYAPARGPASLAEDEKISCYVNVPRYDGMTNEAAALLCRDARNSRVPYNCYAGVKSRFSSWPRRLLAYVCGNNAVASEVETCLSHFVLTRELLPAQAAMLCSGVNSAERVTYCYQTVRGTFAASKDAAVELCQGGSATQDGFHPTIACFNGAKSVLGFSNENAARLCSGTSDSQAPIRCYNHTSNLGLPIARRISLCSGTSKFDGPARCWMSIGEPDASTDKKLDLCRGARDTSPVRCAQLAESLRIGEPKKVTEKTATMLCSHNYPLARVDAKISSLPSSQSGAPKPKLHLNKVAK